MYTEFFGLHEKPFAITPDSRYLYLSERHAEALAHLLYGITESGGFIQLTGEVGTGKTTLIRSLLERLPERTRVALILNPRHTVTEFLQTICEELGVEVSGAENSRKNLVDALNAFLLDAHARGERVILIIDEAQNLSGEILEQVRLLTNLETAKRKLLQIILTGQPELRATLARNDLRQLAQRITGRYHLEPLSLADAAGYIRHRMSIAGAMDRVFSNAAIVAIQRASGGVPRLLNVICDRALLGAYTQERRRVGWWTARRAAVEVQGPPVRGSRAPWLAAAGVLLAMLIGAFLARSPSPPPTAPTVDPAETAATTPRLTLSTQLGLPAAARTVAEAAAPPAEASLPLAEQASSLSELLAASAPSTSTDAAFARLFELWGINLAPERDSPCTQAARHGLQCVFQRGSWNLLQRLNRPVILALSDEAGTLHQTVLSGIEGGEAVLEIGGSAYQVPAATLAEHWLGEYLLLWRPQPGALELLAPGMRGPGVVWLRARLAEVFGEAAPDVADNYYDDDLAAQVMAFQQRAKLKVDGIAGIQTLIALNTATGDPATPVLADRRL